MKKLITIVMMLCIVAGSAFAAPKVKPMKDKATKKYGYVNKEKEWVIEPQFDKAGKFDDGYAIVTIAKKQGVVDEEGNYVIEAIYDDVDKFNHNGLCEVMIKEGKTKYYGVIRNDGKIILPCECLNVSMKNRGNHISAYRYVEIGQPDRYDTDGVWAWGVYDNEGKTIFEPQFITEPKFSISNNYQAIVKHFTNNLAGVITLGGTVLVDFAYLEIVYYSSNGEYNCLAPDLSVVYATTGGTMRGGEMRPGAVVPYQTYDDDFRAIAFGKNGIGIQLHENNIHSISNVTDRMAASGQLSVSGLKDSYGRLVDWGPLCSNFVRLELIESDSSHARNLNYCGQSYTIQANLYDAFGMKLQTLSKWGYISHVGGSAVIYCAEGNKNYVIYPELNAPHNVIRERGSNFRAVSDSYTSVLGLTNADMSVLRDWKSIKMLHRTLMTVENKGLGTYTHFVEMNNNEQKAVLKVMSGVRILSHRFGPDDIRWAKTVQMDSLHRKINVSEPAFLLHNVDEYSPFGLKIEGPEEIFWGAHNDRYIGLLPIPLKSIDRAKTKPESVYGLWDDVMNTPYYYGLQINLYEADGTYVRTIGECHKVTGISKEYLIIEDAGLVFFRKGYRGETNIKADFSPAKTNNLSELNKFLW